MNKKFFYTRFSIGSIRRNRQFYFPYILICVVTAAMYYIMSYIAYDKGMKNMPGASTLIMMLQLGIGVITILGTIFLFYTNSFLIKRRKRELGLYNILGMEKKHVARVMVAETILLAVVSIAAGLAAGILFSKLVMMCLSHLVLFPAPVVFSISTKAIFKTCILFAVIFLFILLFNIVAVMRAKPIELLSAGKAGEREPKSRTFLAAIGIIALFLGYYISITIESPIKALNLFFVAVLLVILGTYCLFTAGSITVLKMLRKNKKFYYQTNHFASVSGMIYRMKQNAAGLSNICILCTMLLVTLSTTICMYAGVEDALKVRYPNDIALKVNYTPEESPDKTGIYQAVRETIKGQGLSLKEFKSFDSTYVPAMYDGTEFSTDYPEGAYPDFSDMNGLAFFTQQDYEAITGVALGLKENETAVYDIGKKTAKEFTLFHKKYKIVKYLKDFPLESAVLGNLVTSNSHMIILPDEAALSHVVKDGLADGNEGMSLCYNIEMNLNAQEQQILKCYQKLTESVAQYDNGSMWWESRDDSRKTFYADYGSFLFIGIFLGILFLMMTVLIIYYKQISEGYDDRIRFEIMQKVGMSQKEVKHTIRTQILMVFMLPILAAVLHITAAFPIIAKLLAIFNLTNQPLFIGCTIGTILIFTLVYILVYTLTSRTYYKIIEA